MWTSTPQLVVDEARPYREEARPSECNGDHGDRPCWVDAPYKALAISARPRCATCGGVIRAAFVMRARYARPIKPEL